MDRPTESSSLATVSDAAMPKSESTGCPYAVRRMLDGLMSRCSTPARWAVSTALPIFTAMRSTSATEMRSRRYRSLSDAEQSSMTRYGRPSAETPAW